MISRRLADSFRVMCNVSRITLRYAQMGRYQTLRRRHALRYVALKKKEQSIRQDGWFNSLLARVGGGRLVRIGISSARARILDRLLAVFSAAPTHSLH